MISLKECKYMLINKESKNKYKKNSFSQSGEDLIVRFIFEALKIRKPSYLDIGAHHPFYLSNTAYFYENGSDGINIEPDPILFKEFIKERKNNINLNIGITDKEDELDFYILNPPSLNTFSKEEAERFEKEHGYKIVKVVKVQVNTIANIIEKYCNGIFPQFLSLDAEGLDEQILYSIDYNITAPIVICVETISFSTSGRGVKNHDLINFLENKGYMVYANTYINTIFVQKKYWIR